MLGPGWHQSERDGCWSKARTAILTFEIDAAGPCDLEIEGYPFVAPSAVTFTLNGGQAVSHDFSGRQKVRLAFQAQVRNKLTIEVMSTGSPGALGEADTRELGFRLESFARVANLENAGPSLASRQMREWSGQP
jgi:hypothetical protein